MTTALKLGPTDHGRKLSEEEFVKGDYQEGYQYELIDGKLYVSPLPNPPQNVIQEWLGYLLTTYTKQNPAVANYCSHAARVVVSSREDVTTPEPDLTLFHDFPLHLPLREIRWEDASPILVVEILSDDPEKDLVRNVELYVQVPTIREYWVIDTREDPDRPTMTVYRRRGRRWRSPITVHFGDTYTTPLLPGFELVLNPRS
jgi:Uma2 family endonuclease